jgi:hypothetical protein
LGKFLLHFFTFFFQGPGFLRQDHRRFPLGLGHLLRPFQVAHQLIHTHLFNGHKVPGPVHQFLRQSQPGGDFKGVAAARLADEQAVGGP